MGYNENDIFTALNIARFDTTIRRYLIAVWIFTVVSCFLYYLLQFHPAMLAIIPILPAVTVIMFYQNKANSIYRFAAFYTVVTSKRELYDYAIKTRFARIIVDKSYAHKAIIIFAATVMVGCIIARLVVEVING